MVEPGDLGLRFGLGQADRAFAFFPLAALLEEFDTLETLEDRTLTAGATGYFERCVFRHDSLE